MSLLQESDWRGRIFSDGWTEGSGAAYPVVSPATGETLGEMGMATPADVTARPPAPPTRNAPGPTRRTSSGPRSCAGPATCGTRTPTRSPAGSMRESGAIRPVRRLPDLTSRAGVLRGGGARLRAVRRAAALRRAPAQPRAPVPVGVVGVIAPFNVPTILVDPLGRPGARARQRGAAQAGPAHRRRGGAVIARDLRRGGPAGRACCTCCPAAPTSGEALVADPRVRVISFTGSTAAGRAVGELAAQHLKRVHLELGGNSALLVLDDVDVEAASSVGAWGSFAHQGQVCMTTGRHLVQAASPTSTSTRSPARADHLPVGDPTTGQVALGPVIDAGSATRSTRWSPASSTRAPGSPPAAPTRACSTGRRCSPTCRPTAGVPARRSSARSRRWSRFDSVDEAVALAARHDVRALAGHPDPRRDARPGDRGADPERPGAHQRPDGQRRGDHPVRRRRRSGTGARHGGAQANLDAFTDTQWVTVRGSLPSYPMWESRPAQDVRGSPRPRRPSPRRGAAWPPAPRG